MGVGRLGNFIDGQIVGAVTNVPWAVQFPDADGFRHPVVLYDGAKNLLLIPYLLWVRRTNPTPGATAARFVFWYAFLRIGIDLFRDYPTHRLALGTGQTLNLVMASVGVLLLVRSRLRRLGRLAGRPSTAPMAASRPVDVGPSFLQRVVFVVLIVASTTIASNWTQDVPARYGARHAGLTHSSAVPQIRHGPTALRIPASGRSSCAARVCFPASTCLASIDAWPPAALASSSWTPTALSTRLATRSTPPRSPSSRPGPHRDSI